MPTKEKEVIVIDGEDDPSTLSSITQVNGCLKPRINLKTKQDQRDRHSAHSDLKYRSVASVRSALYDPSLEDPATPQANHNLSQASPGHSVGRSSYSYTNRSSQLLPRASGKETLTAYSPTNQMDRPYFATPSWSFAAPAASRTEVATPPKPISTSDEIRRRGGRNLNEANMTSRRFSSLFQGARVLQRPIVTEVTEDDDSTDDEDLAHWMAQDAEDELRRSSIASSDSKAAIPRRSSAVVPRNLPITSPFVNLDTFTYNGIPLAQKVYLELKDGDFLRIVHIVQDTSTSAVTLRGWKFRRTRELNDLMEKKRNEVCWILHIDEDDSRDAKLQGMETVPVHEIVKRRRIRLTNQSFPALSYRDDGNKEKIETVENERVLVCRFKYLCFYTDAKARVVYKWYEKVLQRLREDECDQRPDNTMTDEELRRIWRGDTVAGGMQEGWLPGEKEFLRQEDVSHRGISSRSSLKAPSGPDFPMGDPMKRGSVGPLLTENELQLTADQDTQSSHFDYSSSNGLLFAPKDHDTYEDYDVSALGRSLRQSSLQPGTFRDKSPRIVEIDAQVKTSSSSGTFEKRYEGKITSRFYPTPPLAQRKRSADISLGSPTRPRKKIDQGFRPESHHVGLQGRYDGQKSRTLCSQNRYVHQEPASSDSDRTLGRSQSPESVEEMHTPSKRKDCKTSISGLLTPVSRRKDTASDITLPPRMGGFSAYPQPPTPISRTARSSVVNKVQTYGNSDHDDGTVDLIRPQANPYGTLLRARSSLSRQSDPSVPFHARSVFSSNLNKISSPNEKSSRPTSAHPLLNSKNDLISNSRFPGSLAASPGSSQPTRMPATPSPSSRRSRNAPQQNRNTTMESPAAKANQRRYSFGDCFCGAGGMSRGAVSAGLRVSWGFDFNLKACQTYQMNFFGTPIYNVWANQFLEAKGDHKVDICHLSPPCQFFSDAHTVQGKDDEQNTASLFAIFNLLEKAKPRIVTLEQTSGLIRRHHKFFNAVINIFTSRGFSVRWKVMNCADFGLPQRRMRLFILASCPGEALPPFPKSTHSSEPEKTGLKPWTTISETIAKIPHGWANHDIHLTKERDIPPQSGDKIATCITTSGGGIIHPSGKRDYTHREFACLQSFPLGHKFGASGVKKQVGNAVPPAMAQVLLETVVNALLKADGLL